MYSTLLNTKRQTDNHIHLQCVYKALQWTTRTLELNRLTSQQQGEHQYGPSVRTGSWPLYTRPRGGPGRHTPEPFTPRNGHPGSEPLNQHWPSVHTLSPPRPYKTTLETHTGSLLTHTAPSAAGRGKCGQRWMYRRALIDDDIWAESECVTAEISN